VSSSIQSRVFECAADILGGQSELRDRLRISPSDLARWLTNQETSPLPIFFRAVDILLASEQGFGAIFSASRGARFNRAYHSWLK
jgi:hypothetical protein